MEIITTTEEADEKGFIVAYVDGVYSIIEELEYLEVPFHHNAKSDELVSLLYSMQSENYDVDHDLYIIIDDLKLEEERKKEYVLLLEDGRMIREDEDNLFELRYYIEQKYDIRPQNLNDDDYDCYVGSICSYTRERKIMDEKELYGKIEEVIEEIEERNEID